ncbi:Heat shock 70 kDa protein 12B [Mizuhopecten yessoensis]|uniref:Heat shock 70 kDa protein n=2 Tax=Mizuhopecten yessoensis TaxID=6573 RepID=A0A1C9U317_MIZYE|nr:heat shock 70 kDa protein [Mizuhopecten yessoensis]OWF39273.1 Heat shock 70 kDa protein 12B [Mizuhopecten yessoensis]
MREAVKTSPYGEDLHVIGDKLKISDRLFRRFFDPTIREILKRIDKILTEEKSHDVNDLFVVGSFAEYKLVQNTIREKFGKKRIIIPHQADYAVSRGSVLYGHIAMMPTVTRYTYGCQHWPMFNNKEHPLNKLMVLNGEIRCKDIFYTLQERGVTVSSGYKVSHLVQVLVPKDGTLNVTIYVSKGQEPRFIDDDGCTPLGTMTVHLASSMQGPVELNKTLTFQDNGIVLEITEKATGQLYDTTFPFL